tara:strand:- start:44 stop:268 length:225 start_codon:yes stop_codon:yes gene_type:complete
MYEIEKNVPHTKINKHGKWNQISKQMKPGDSVLVKNIVEAQSLRSALKRDGHKARSRAIKENGETIGQRVWRIK